ncbi:hypothetical protein Klosneuvirus_2_247 [Klosneuvirus KNV1]|uniref:Uncharacterized protein n=1 Tax=Klosneuvirus KNV1 TaxID=1977640 RepID=A0A1V0SJH8_9VIRU|nr:hypothetical protein Klosneuvirus_2_247 [Klosneuvirus KNV1]
MYKYIFTVTYEAKLVQPTFTLTNKDYVKSNNIIKYHVTIDGNKIEIKDNNNYLIHGSLVDNNNSRIHGGLCSNNQEIVHSYYLGLGTAGGGRFIIFKDNLAEFTHYGSGKPIISSMIGYLSKN